MPEAYGGEIIARFITWRVTGSWWNCPSLIELLSLNVPVSIVYGEKDNIMPAHAGHLVVQLSASSIKCHIILKAWHMPHLIDGGRPFCDVIRSAFGTGTDKVVLNDNSDVLRRLTMDETWRATASTFSLTGTERRINSMYKHLMEDNDMTGISPHQM